jgi:uncharacterized Tic20 family protein
MNDTIPLKFRCLAAGIHLIAAIPVTGVLIVPILWVFVNNLDLFVDRSGRDAINCAMNTFMGTMVSLLFSVFVFSVTCGAGNQDPTLVVYSLILVCGVAIAYFINSLIAAIFALRGYRFHSRLIYPFIRDE